MGSATMKSRGDRYQGVEKESFAYKMMGKLGWQEGRGLGANEQGIKSHIKAKKKDDALGVGVVEEAKIKGDWTANTSTYDRILENLRSHHQDQEGAEAEPTTSSGGAGDEKTNNKKKKKEKKSKKKLVRAQGRYKKRESAKCVKNYSAEDLAVILGANSDDVFAKLHAAHDEPAAKEEEDAHPAKKKERIVIELKLDEGARKRDYKPAKLASDWWGNKMFTQSTRLLGDQEVTVKGDKGEFTEKDQEDIYENAHKAFLGKRIGLGMAHREKWEGGKWEGEKKTFDEDEDGEDGGSESDRSSDMRLEISGGRDAAAKASVSKSKLKELIVGALKAKKKKLKASKLKQHVFAEVAENVANVEKFFKVLQSESRKFAFDGKKVKLL